MSQEFKPAVENYILEIISRSESLKSHCKELMASDYASDTPKKLLIAIHSSSDFIENSLYNLYKKLDWANSTIEDIFSIKKNLNSFDILIKRLGFLLKFISDAKTTNIPWNIVNSIENFTKNNLPNTRLIITPNYEYNYSIIPADLFLVLKKYLSELQDYYPEESIDEVLSSLINHHPLHIASFPYLERDNILLHCLLSHEIGHLFIIDYFADKTNESNFLLNIRDEIYEITTRELYGTYTGLDQSVFKDQLIQKEFIKNLYSALRYWKKGLEELLADFIGVLTFGPAVLFSALEFAFQFELDAIPQEETGYYPPWRKRLREIFCSLTSTERLFFPIANECSFSMDIKKAMQNRYELINEIISDKKDVENINNDKILKIAYRELDKNFESAKVIYSKRLVGKIVMPDALYKVLPMLIERLENLVPPNSYGKDALNEHPSSMVQIINAAWFNRVLAQNNIFDISGKISNDAKRTKSRINKLTLKAIEYEGISTNIKNAG